MGVNGYLTQNAKLSSRFNCTQFAGSGTAAAATDRRDEQALFTRLTIHYPAQQPSGQTR